MRNNIATLGVLLILAVSGSLTAVAQTLTGRVTSEGSGLAGVNVIVRTTNRGTTTDADGKYSVRIDPGTY